MLGSVWRDPVWRWLAFVSIGIWFALGVVWFFQGVMWSILWVLGVGVVAVLGIAAVVTTTFWVARSVAIGANPLAVSIATVAVLVAAVAVGLPWGDVYGRVWFGLHRDDFVLAEELVRTGAIDPAADYYGATLPDGLATISITGRISATTEWGEEPGLCGQPIEFVPAAVGIPDGGVGFVHLPCDDPPAGFEVNAFDDAVVPRISLGDGWWWADGVVPDGYFSN